MKAAADLAKEVVKTTHCETITDFLNAISPRGQLFRSFLPGAWIFRGHGNDEEYTLLPSALRWYKPGGLGQPPSGS